MDTNSSNRVESDNSIINFFKTCSPKLTPTNCVIIFEVVWLISAFLYLYDLDHTTALITAISACLSHLFIDYFIFTPKMERKFTILLIRFTILIKRIKAELFQEKTNRNKPAYDLMKDAYHKAMEEKEVVLRQNNELLTRNLRLFNDVQRIEKKKDEVREKVSSVYVKEIQRLSEALSQERDIEKNRAIKLEERSEKFMSDMWNYLKIVEEERKDVSQLEKKYSDLLVDLESERVIYKSWRDRENSLRKKLEEEKENLGGEIEEERMMNARLEYQVEKLEEEKEKLERGIEGEKMINTQLEYQVEKLEELREKLERGIESEKMINTRLEYQVEKLEEQKEKYLMDFELERKKNEEYFSFLKGLNERAWNLLKADFGDNLSELKELIEKVNDESEQKKMLEVEKRCKKLEEDKESMVKMIISLQEERDNLTDDNRLLKDNASRNLTDRLQGKVECFMEILKDHIETNEVNSEKLLENQDNLLKMLKESLPSNEEEDDTSCDESQDGYEVVEEI